MLREREFFGDAELILIYMARRLREARTVEEVLNAGAVEYTVIPDEYRGGVFFTSKRIGAFFYVLPQSEPQARALLLAAGFIPLSEADRANLDKTEGPA